MGSYLPPFFTINFKRKETSLLAHVKQTTRAVNLLESQKNLIWNNPKRILTGRSKNLLTLQYSESYFIYIYINAQV